MPSWICKIWQFVMNVMGKVIDFVMAVLKGLLDLAVAALDAVVDSVGDLLGSPGGILLLILGGFVVYKLITSKDDEKKLEISGATQ